MRRIALLQLLFALCVPLCTVGAELSGVLRDNQGNGIGGITVSADIYLTAGSTQLVVTTDSVGCFTMTGEPEWWRMSVSAADLNARGFFSVSGPSLSVTGQSVLRLTTRKLDFTHRVLGRLIDEAGGPLGGCSLRARIWENNALFETNVVTDTNGSFTLAAVPAVWSFCCLEAPTERVFGERLVEVEVTNVEKQVTFVVPTATSTISVTTSNIGGRDLVVSADAFGETIRLVQAVPIVWSSHSPPGFPTNTFRVFDGVWTISATNGEPNRMVQSGAIPEPATVAVTNGIVAVVLSNVATAEPVLQMQRVRTVTVGGQVVSNAAVYASSGSSPGVLPSPLLQPTGTPEVAELWLADGRWWLTASTATSPRLGGWNVSRQVLIVSNTPPPEVTLVFPETNSGPRISGTIRIPSGPGLASRSVWLRMTDGGTNYGIDLETDALGSFGAHVIPGRWVVSSYPVYGPLLSVVVVSNQDVQVDFDVLMPVRGQPVSVNVSVVDEAGPPVSESWFNMSSGFDYAGTNGSPGVELLLQPGIWQASIQMSVQVGQTHDYTLFPSLNWFLPPDGATNVVILTRQTPARIEGRLRDESGRLLQTGYATAWTSVNGTNFWSSSSIASGYFSLNVFPGEWQVGASVSRYPSVGWTESDSAPAAPIAPGGRDASQPTSHYTTPAARWVRVSNDLVRCEFVTTNVPIQLLSNLRVTVVREDGGIVGGVYVSAYGRDGFEGGTTDGNGVVSLAVPRGLAKIGVEQFYALQPDEPLLWPALSLDITAPSNHVVLVVRQPTACLGGTVSNAPALGLQPRIRASAQISGTNYFSRINSDSTGHYCLPAAPGPWTVWIDDASLKDFGLQSVAQRSATIPPTGQAASVDFVLAPVVGDFREAQLSSPMLRPDGALQLELRGQSALTWRLERSADLINWTPFALGAVVNGRFVLQEPLAPSGKATFYRAVWVR